MPFREACRFAFRQPLFTGLVVGMLALGIGGATAMFSVVRGVLLTPLPYGRPGELVWMFGAFRLNDAAAVSPPDFVDYRARNQVFDSIGAMTIAPSAVTVLGTDTPQRLNAATVSAGLITTLGIPPVVGRDFLSEEERGGAAPVVISERLWRDQFSGAANAIGRTVRVDGITRTIVGVMPAGFTLPFDPFIRLTDPVDLYVPLQLDDPGNQVRRFHFLRVIGRLAPGHSIDGAQAHMDTLSRQLEATYPENATWKLRLLPLHERMVGDLRRVLSVLMGAVLALLLVACANVAGLLVARGLLRQPEIALRLALGASRPRILAQLLLESLVLSVMGMAAGVVLATWLVQILKGLAPPDLPRLQDARLDPMVFAFALVLACITALVGTMAALHSATPPPSVALRRSGGSIGHRSGTALRSLLVGVQVAVSCTLLVGAGLLALSLWRLQAVDPGFATDGVVLSQISLPDDRFDEDARVAAWFDDLIGRLDASPGVAAAALASGPPLAGGGDAVVHEAGHPPASDRERRYAQLRLIAGDYFSAVGIPIVAGRGFEQTDGPGGPAAAVISQRMAHAFFPGRNAVGERLVVDGESPIDAEIVGIAGDARIFGQAVDPPPIVYLSQRQYPRRAAYVVLRMAADPGDAAPLLRRTVRALDATIAVGRVQTLRELLDASRAQPRLRTALVVLFAAVALALTLGGLYGALSWAVAQRTRELGVRMALGATPRALTRLVLAEGARVVIPGVAAGILGGLAAGRLVRDLLFDVQAFEPILVGGVAAGVTMLALLAVAGPGRRAARVDPLVALRTD